MPETPRRPSRPPSANPCETPAPEAVTAPPADVGTPALPEGLPKQLPAMFGRYELLELIGQGGMGVVYLARDTQLDRRVALKVALFGPNSSAAARERFQREARAAAALNHPGVCAVHDVGVQDGFHYLTMAYLEGQPLRTVIRINRPVPERAAAAIARQIAQAMQVAHERGVVHRDLKPTNIMITPQRRAVVMDFGLATVGDVPVDARLTRDGSTLGTPAYMAPEQVRGDKSMMGPSVDIYALGVILYEMLAGKLPFSLKAGLGPLMLRIANDPPRPMQKYRPDLDPGLEAVVLKALAKRPEERFASMREFAAVLEPYAKGSIAVTATVVSEEDLAAQTFAGLMAADPTPPATPRPPAPPRKPRSKALLWGIVGGGAALLLAGLVAVAAVIWFGRKPDETGPGVVGLLVAPTAPRAVPVSTGPTPPPQPPALPRPEPPQRELVARMIPSEYKPLEPLPTRATPPPPPPVPTQPPAQPPRRLRQPPARDELARWDKDVLALFQKDITAAERDRPAQGRLLDEVRRTAEDARDVPGKDNSTQRFALRRLEQRQAVRWAQPQVALTALAELAREFDLEVLKEKHDILEAALKRIEELKIKPGLVNLTPDQWLLAAHELAESVLGLEEEAATAGAWRSAEMALTLAERAGKLLPNTAVGGRVRAHRRDLMALQADRAKGDQAAAKLKDSPDDPAANGERGRWLLKSGSDWPAALPLLAKAGGPWGEAAVRDTAGPAEPTARVAVGDAWWTLALAEHHPRLRARLLWRATYWYDLALDGLSGVERKEPERKIREARRAPEPKPPSKIWAENFLGAEAGGLGTVNEPALEAGYLGGRYYFQFRQVSDRFLNSQRSPVAAYFACRLSAAVAVGPGAAWSLQMNAADGSGLNFRIGNGQCRVQPTLLRERSYTLGKPLLDVPVREFKPDKPNALLVVVRGRRVEVFVNGVSVCEPLVLERDLSPCKLSLAGHPRDLPTRIEFDQFTVWSAEGVDAPEARAAAVK